MSYIKLLSARRNSGRLPSMKPVRLTEQQKQWADQGRCIQCGIQVTCRNSYICQACQTKDSLEDIQADIHTLRQKILSRTGK